MSGKHGGWALGGTSNGYADRNKWPNEADHTRASILVAACELQVGGIAIRFREGIPALGG